MDPLRGEYGFLTQFSGISEADARSRVRNMWEAFRVLEFQFYDAFEGYSRPPSLDQAKWKSAFGRPVSRAILKAYVDEISKLGGRSWFYVQAMGTDPDDVDMQAGAAVIGQHIVDGQPLLDVVAPTVSWAQRIAPGWARFAASLGFSGIHWDTLGDKYGAGSAGADVPGFLRATQPILQVHGLAQTCNFVDGYGWDRSLFGDVGWVGNVVAFPYWEAWTLPEKEDVFFNEVTPRGGGVFVCYPGKSPAHTGEEWNRAAEGIWPLDLLILRWLKARCHGSTYLAIGDGSRHIQDEYFPDSVTITEHDVHKIRDKVFKKCTFNPVCSEESGLSPWFWPLSIAASAGVFALGRLSSYYHSPFSSHEQRHVLRSVEGDELAAQSLMSARSE